MTAQIISFPPAAASAHVFTSTVEYTIVLPLGGQDYRVRDLVHRITATLFAQNISFEVIAVSDRPAAEVEDFLDDLWFTRIITDPEITGLDTAVDRGVSAARGAWVGVVDLDEEADVCPYQVVESLHRAREYRATVA